MERMIDRLIGALQRLKSMDASELKAELEEFWQHASRQVFSQIPGVSALAAFSVAGWVASRYTTSPFKATLAQWGIIKGGRYVVSTPTYKLLSLGLPMVVGALTAYFVQKLLKRVRELRLESDMAKVAKLGVDVQTLVKKRMDILDKAKAAELLTASEYMTKKANLYAAYSRILPSKVHDLIMSKLA
jgi:ABC-type transporter lipoprotein component MlaA